ncbi:nicolin-1 [Parasteatoda tepidariorum]|uniref:nicolin-1 n=1 Tax=Parasteatoda tepidariorum TaxID=114398 RepID=UPI001C719ABE|nr:nicolin-1 [Parasteatoda tepidariorum]
MYIEYAAMHLPDEKKQLDFKAKAPVSIFLDDDRADYKPGCSVMEISFPEPVTISEIRFRNNYTAFISFSCKKVASEKDVKNRDILPWQASIRRFILMQEPESERSSQDIFSISAKDSGVTLNSVVNLRIILKQPSYRWKRFGIEELTFFGELTKDSKQTVVSYPLSAGSRRSECKNSTTEINKNDSMESPRTKYILAISDVMKDKQATGCDVGRFEVEGFYDIGHLV